MRRRDFIQMAFVAATAAACDVADMMPLFVATPFPWRVDDRLLRTLHDLAMAGFRFEVLRLSEAEWRRIKPPVGYSYRDRCNAHTAALAGKPTQRKLRCLICEAHEVPHFWRWPVLLRGQFLRIF
jgi:hypothetical protein